MKKIIAIVLMTVLVLSCASCGRTNMDNDDTQNPVTHPTPTNKTDTTKVKDAKDLLDRLWATYEERDTDNYMYNDKFSILGGHYESYTEEAPGKYDLTKAEDLERSFCFPKDKMDFIDDAATMTHMLMANNFSAAAYHVKDASKVNELITAIEDCTLRNQWLDGEPDELLIATVGNQYVISVYGEDDLIHYFRVAIQQVYGDSAKIITQVDLD